MTTPGADGLVDNDYRSATDATSLSEKIVSYLIARTCLCVGARPDV